MKQSKRVFYFDALRAMAIIGIVFCHAAITFVVTGINNSDFYISAFFDCFRDFSISSSGVDSPISSIGSVDGPFTYSR